jgi:hypothetical protein
MTFVRLDLSNTISADVAEDGARRRIHAVLRALFPHAPIKERGDEIRIGTWGSLSLQLHTFEWYDHEEGEGGKGVLSLIQYRKGYDFPKALSFVRTIISNPHNTISYHPLEERQQQRLLKQQEQERKRRQAYVQSLWKHAVKVAPTSPVTRYLAGRGIAWDNLPTCTQNEMRFLMCQHHRESDTSFPVLLAALRRIDGELMAVLRIFLTQDGSTKAPVDPPKKALGTTAGAAIHLTPARPHLILTEGLEDGLTVLLAVQGQPDVAVWSAVGGNIHSVIVPRTVQHVTLALDNDEAGKRFAQKTAERLQAEGFSVSITLPAIGKDFNDMLVKHGQLPSFS